MAKPETKDTFHQKTWELNPNWWWNLVTLCPITKKNNFFFKKFFGLESICRSFYVDKELSGTYIGKWSFMKQADDLGYLIANLSKYTKISMQTLSDSFLQKIL